MVKEVFSPHIGLNPSRVDSEDRLSWFDRFLRHYSDVRSENCLREVIDEVTEEKFLRFILSVVHVVLSESK